LVSTSVRRLLFRSRTNVFLSGKAETTAKTRQVFHRPHEELENLQTLSARENKRTL